MKVRGIVALLLASMLMLVVRPARAQMSEGEKKATARALYQEGVKLQDQGKPVDALAKFQTAEKLYDAPTHLLHIAECQALLGKLVEATETYETLIHVQLPTGSPEPFVQAQAQARAEAPVLQQRIPTLRVTVKPDPSTLQGLVIKIDDRQMPNELVGIARPINPGSYHLTAAANGWATRAPVDVELKEKDVKSVELVLQQGAPGAVVVPVPPPYGTAGGEAPASSSAPPNGAEQSKPPPKPAGSQTGLLFGAHGGMFVPAGNVAQTANGSTIGFDRVGSAGGGIGLDFLARFARVFLVGLRADAIFLGGPDAKTVTAGQTITSSTNMFGAAVILGLLTSHDHVGFYGDLGLGLRSLNYSQSAPPAPDQHFGGSYLALGAGLSIPAGPIRIVPKVGVDFGSLKSSETCTGPTCIGPTTAAGTTSVALNQSGSYQMFFVGVTVFYDLDLDKKAKATGATAGL